MVRTRQSDRNIGKGGDDRRREDGEEGVGLKKWHLDISQKTNSNPGHSYDKLIALITTAVGQKLTSAERSRESKKTEQPRGSEQQWSHNTLFE